MGKDLKIINKKFKELLNRLRKKKEYHKEIEDLFYFFYLQGWVDGSRNDLEGVIEC